MSTTAYFSMEIGLESGVPTYAGGLGVLAGDTLRAAADLDAPLVAVTLVHRKGYFRQSLDEAGDQSAGPDGWAPEERLEPVDAHATVELDGRAVKVRAWRWRIRGRADGEIPVYLLDTDLPDNAPEDRAITDHLYGGEVRDRLRQEAVLGLAGVAILEDLGVDVGTFHLNEGHSGLLALALLEAADGDLDAVRERCVFTTHTPVPAGHDRFDLDLVRTILGPARADRLEAIGAIEDGRLNMTRLALAVSRFVNGVSWRHAAVSREMFPGHRIEAITNGVHVPTWTAPSFAELFDRFVPGWRRSPANLRHAVTIPGEAVREAHDRAKRRLLAAVLASSDVELDPDAFTIGFARRASAYKRADLVFSDPDRLERIAADHGPLQLLFAGKAHPSDEIGQGMIRSVHQAASGLGDDVRVVWLEDYDMEWGARLVAGVDLWLNNPRKPQEASGTSGMKAALNGVPNLSVLDGWWIEGHVEGVTGWAIGETWEGEPDADADAASIYEKLEGSILPVWSDDPEAWASIMRSSIALNGSFFTAERMLRQYMVLAYRR